VIPDVVIQARGLAKQYVRGPEGTLRLREAVARLLGRPYRRLRRLPPRRPPATGRRETFWALRDVSFDVRRGERLGIIGRNGAGKSTLLKILSRVVYPTAGEARLRGRVTSLLEVGTGFNPNLTGRENVYLNASIHGLDEWEIEAHFDEIVAFSGIADFLDTAVKHYSSGMFMRLAFSVAAHLDPDILLLDEVLAVGDLAFQQKCLARVEGLTSQGRTVLFVSHNMDAIARFCDRCLWLEGGRIVRDGPAVEVIDAYVREVFGVSASRSWAGDLAGTAAPLGEGPAGGPEGDGLRERPGRAPDGTPAADGPREAAATELVRLVSARVVNGRRETVSTVLVHEPVGIEIVYDILREGKNIQPALHFKTSQDAYAFVVAYTDPLRMHEPPPRGRYRATAWLPPNLLNEGVMSVSIVMAVPDPLERLWTADRAISFNVIEPIDSTVSTARGLYARAFPGVVRPRLEWETQRLGDEVGDPRAEGAPPRGSVRIELSARRV
jgi:lipopolysaccharide transport system ATP-binding protein